MPSNENINDMNKFVGKWKITDMEQWDQEYIDLMEPGYYLFDNKGMGEFVFGTVSGFIDCRYDDAEDTEKVEYSWEGTSDMDLVCGRGWFKLTENGQLYGRLFIHNSDDSWVKADKQ